MYLPSESKLQKTHLAYVILIDRRVGCGNISLRKLGASHAPGNDVVVNKGIPPIAKSGPDQQGTVVRFGYMAEKEYVERQRIHNYPGAK
jgi:hypothetical protein